MNRQDSFRRGRRLVATTLLGAAAGSIAAHATDAIPLEPTVGRLAIKRVDIVDGPDPIDASTRLYVRSTDGASIPPVSPNGSVGSSETAVDLPGGRALVLWSERAGGVYRVALAPVSDDGFLPGALMSAPSAVDPRPSATFLPDRSAWVVYVESDGVSGQVFRRTASPTTGIWGAPEAISLPGEMVSSAHVVAHDGAAHVVYARRDGPATSIVHATHDGASWNREVVGTSAYAGEALPQIHSHAGVLWIDWVDAQAPTGAGELGWKRRDPSGAWEATRYTGFDTPLRREFHDRPGIRLQAIVP